MGSVDKTNIIPFGHKWLQIYVHFAWTVSRLNREESMVCQLVGSLNMEVGYVREVKVWGRSYPPAFPSLGHATMT